MFFWVLVLEGLLGLHRTIQLHDAMDCSPPGASIHGVFQARVPEWGAIAFSVIPSNAEEAEVERLYEDLQDFSELTSKKDVFFIVGDWNAKKKTHWS